MAYKVKDNKLKKEFDINLSAKNKGQIMVAAPSPNFKGGGGGGEKIGGGEILGGAMNPNDVMNVIFFYVD